MIDEIKIYAVFDTRKQQYWETRKGKKSWSKSAHAKNAWNNDRPTDEYPELTPDENRYWKRKTFNEQDIFEIHEFTFTKANMKVIK